MTRPDIHRPLRLVLAALVVVIGHLFTPAPAHAQNSSAAGPGTPGAQTLDDILRRQEMKRRGLELLPLRKPLPPPATALPDQLRTLGPQSDPDIWRAVKAGERARPSSSTASGQLMQVLGEEWRMIRRQYILPWSWRLLAGVVILIALFRLVRGRIPIRAGRSGKTIPRFSLSHRVAHWFLASVFILMAISGLIILLGRPLLLPLIGREVVSVLASASLQGHNLFGPIFILALVIVTVRFMRGNFFQWADLQWILKGGGLLGGHASSHHYNFGEKTWYWTVVLVGLVMSATGLLLLFPWVSDNLLFHQIATIAHALGAVILIAFALGHAYIGSIGMEGSIDAMLRGEVDENWAREHHDLWYEEVTGKKADLSDAGDDRAQAEEVA